MPGLNDFNPALRLLEWTLSLEKTLKESNPYIGSLRIVNMGDEFPQLDQSEQDHIFNFAPLSCDSLVFRRAGLLREVALEASVALRDAEAAIDLYVDSWAQDLEQLLGPWRLTTNGSQVTGNLRAAITGLRYASDLLSRLPGQERRIDEDELSDMSAELTELRATLNDSELPEGVKNVLLHRIGDIVDAVIEYRFGGAPRVQRAFEAGLGSVVIHHVQIPQRERESISSVFLRIWATLGHVLQAKELGQGAEKLLSKLPEFLE